MAKAGSRINLSVRVLLALAVLMLMVVPVNAGLVGEVVFNPPLMRVGTWNTPPVILYNLTVVDVGSSRVRVCLDWKRERISSQVYHGHGIIFLNGIAVAMSSSEEFWIIIPNPIFTLCTIIDVVDGDLIGVGGFESFSNYAVRVSLITSYSNTKTNDDSLDIAVNSTDSITFNATAGQPITLWEWFKNGVNQNTNYDNFTTTFTAGTHNISVNATNANGTSSTITWEVNSTVGVTSATIPCPIGWCYIASNYSSKTLLEIDTRFSTDTIQGFYGNVSKKNINHRTGYAFNEYQSVIAKQGYYYYFTSAQDVTITIPESHSIQLITGWNLISNFGANRTLSALATSVTNVTAKQRYNATTKKWIDDDSETVKQGEAFFVSVTAPTVWTN